MKINNLFIAVVLCVLTIPAFAQGGKFTVSGRIDGAVPGDRVVLVRFSSFEYSPNAGDRTDTVGITEGGRFSFSAKLAAECPAKLLYLASDGKKEPFPPNIYFALPKGKTVINASSTDFRKSAQVENDLYDRRAKVFIAADDSLDAAKDTLRARASRAMAAKDTVTANRFRDEWEKTKQKLQDLYYAFFKEDTPFAAFAYISTARIYRDDADAIRKVYDGFSPRAKKSSFAAIVKSKADYADSMRKGSPCPELWLTDRNGKKINLADYAGRYLLISHWGAACPGSHYADPLIAKIYEKYHPHGLEILGMTDPSRVYIHFDDISKAPKDMKAYILNTFKHPYPNIDLSQGDNYLFPRRFNVGGTPYLVFVSPEGKILDVSLGVEALDTVEKIMKPLAGGSKEK